VVRPAVCLRIVVVQAERAQVHLRRKGEPLVGSQTASCPCRLQSENEHWGQLMEADTNYLAAMLESSLERRILRGLQVDGDEVAGAGRVVTDFLVLVDVPATSAEQTVDIS